MSKCVLGFLALCQLQIVTSLHIEEKKCPFEGMCGTDCLGTDYGGRYLFKEVMPYLKSLVLPTVWSFGVGGDVSFEVGFACKYGFKIDLFDPSPSCPKHMEAIRKLVGTKDKYMGNGTLPAHSKCKTCKTYWDDVAYTPVGANQLLYHEFAIADKDGNLTFYGNHNIARNATGSWTLDPGMRPSGVTTVKVPAMRLSSLMRTLHTKKIDVLKLDVEGIEISVFEQLLALQDNALPGLIYADMDSMGKATCAGTEAQCGRRQSEAKDMLARMQRRGYKLHRFHPPDMAFYRV